MAAPPPLQMGPPPVPEGWRADWSPQYNTWYFFNLATGTSQWNNPLPQPQFQPQHPSSLPPYSATPPQAQNYQPPQQYAVGNGPHDPLPGGPDSTSDRGFGKAAGMGVFATAGAAMAGTFIKHEIDERKQKKQDKPSFPSWGGGQGGGGMFGGLTSQATAATGGLFGTIKSHIPFSGHSSSSSSRSNSPKPVAAHTVPLAAVPLAAAPIAVAAAVYPAVHHSPPPAANYPPPAANYPPPAANYPPPVAVQPSVAAGFFGGHAHTKGGVPQLNIHCAAYADRDVTQAVRSMVTPEQSINFDTNKFTTYFGDPWPDHHKQFSCIYSYGPRPWEMFATDDGSEPSSILPGQPLDKRRMEFISNHDANSRILAVVWGNANGLEKNTVEKIKELETTGEFEATNGWMEVDGMWHHLKVAQAYYRTEHGGVGVAFAREEGTCRLPWNPLAQWT